MEQTVNLGPNPTVNLGSWFPWSHKSSFCDKFFYSLYKNVYFDEQTDLEFIRISAKIEFFFT